MAGHQPLSSIADIPALKNEVDKIIEELMRVQETLHKMPKLTSFFQNSGSYSEHKKATEEIIQLNNKVTQAQTDLNRQVAESVKNINVYAQANRQVSDSISTYNGKSEEYIRDLVSARLENQRMQAAIKDEIRLQQAAEGSLAKKRLELKKLQQQYDQMAAAERNAAKGNELLHHLQAVDKEVKELEQSTGRFQRSVGNYKESFKEGVGEMAGSLKTFALQAGAAFSAGELLKESIEDVLEKEQNTARLKATLDNLGRSDAFDRLRTSAERFSKHYAYLTDNDIYPVFEKLVTYGKLTEKQINELTPVIVDFAAKQRISLTEATDVMTKALEGSGKALKTYGINVKDAEDEGERFGIIMTDLKDKVAGASSAFADTAQGNIAKTKKEFKELKEELGSGLLPVLNAILKGVNYVIIGFKDLASKVQDAFLLLTNNAEYAFKKMADHKRAVEEEADEFAEGLIEKIGKLTNKELEKRKKAEEENIKNTERIMKSKSQFIDEEDKKMAEQHKANSEKIIDQIKIEIDHRKGRKFHPDDNKNEAEEIEELDKWMESYNKRLGEYLKLRAEIERNRAATLQGIGKDRVDAQVKGISDPGLAETNRLTAGRDTDLKKLDEAYANGLISFENYQARKEQIQYQYGQKILENEISTAQKILDVHKINGIDIGEDEKKLADLKIKLSDQVTKKVIDNEKKEAEAIKKEKDRKKELRYEEQKAALQIAGNVSEIIGGAYTNQLNSLQEQINANNLLKSAETERITRSTLNEQQKAAQLQILQAQTAAKNEELIQKQNAIKMKEARFNRDAQALQILGNTLVAASKAGWVTPEAIAIEAAGAIQIAALLAKPLPRFEKGTMNAPEGLAIVGEKGPELRIDTSGQLSLTPGAPTLTHLEAGTKIIPNDKVDDAMLAMMMQNTAAMAPISVKDESAKKIDKLIKLLTNQHQEVLNHAERIAKNYPPIIINGGIDPGYYVP
jgi:hypothetical protein